MILLKCFLVSFRSFLDVSWSSLFSFCISQVKLSGKLERLFSDMTFLLLLWRSMVTCTTARHKLSYPQSNLESLSIVL